MADSPGYTLAAVLVVDAATQLAAFIPSALQKTEKYFDVSATFSYTLCLLLSLVVEVNPIWKGRDSYHPRQVVATVFGLVWTWRLGAFLYLRIKATGEDKRFRELKQSIPKFSIAWIGQILWVFVTPLPIYTINGLPAASQPAFGTAADIVGILIWVAGITIEVIADAQKWQFKRRSRTESDPAFIHTGLWSWSRHPNYFGEITLWIGMFILCASSFSGALWAVIVAPLFVIVLLCFGSGIPMLEKSADERFGNSPEYQHYKANTSVLVPLPPKKGGHHPMSQ